MTAIKSIQAKAKEQLQYATVNTRLYKEGVRSQLTAHHILNSEHSEDKNPLKLFRQVMNKGLWDACENLEIIEDQMFIYLNERTNKHHMSMPLFNKIEDSMV